MLLIFTSHCSRVPLQSTLHHPSTVCLPVYCFSEPGYLSVDTRRPAERSNDRVPISSRTRDTSSLPCFLDRFRGPHDSYWIPSGSKADHSSATSTAKIQNGWRYTSARNLPSRRAQNFICTFTVHTALCTAVHSITSPHKLHYHHITRRVRLLYTIHMINCVT